MEIPRITTEQVADRMRRGERVVFVDARSAHAYGQASEQLPGSIRIAPDAIEGHTEAVPRDAVAVAYCT